ncbi:hypothetical protein ZIOFF_029504 [Zingiber officinale]|uniref:Apple domain-containing protein n=1 Tax=Zingiber officinale TaxID=94328 RepID=A0A8J5LAN0_ZINOF|nr:hypothetical protein ZIOFF_029504 [Zingiber officinale]
MTISCGCKGCSNFSKHVILFLIILLFSTRECCEDHPHASKRINRLGSERRALLSIKSDLYKSDYWLSSWTGYDCCKWRGVSCDNTTNHVIRLDLHYPLDQYLDLPKKKYIPLSLGDLCNLETLDLSLNNIGGELTNLLDVDVGAEGRGRKEGSAEPKAEERVGSQRCAEVERLGHGAAREESEDEAGVRAQLTAADAGVLGGVIMLTSFIFRVLILIFVYAYPASECYKTLELNKQEIEQLRFWCQYWLPFYYGAKLGAFLYLWHPRTKGATFVYETFLAPFIAEHESEIDPSLFEFRARAADWGLIAWQMAVSYLQTSVPEMKKYAISLMPTMNSIEGEKNYIYFFFTSIYVVNDEPHRRGTTSNASALSNMTLEECQSLCWTNCSCVAFSMIRDNMCLSWPADLMDIRVFAQGSNDLYVRLAASELVKPDIVDPSTPKETELDLSMVSIRAATNEFSRDNIVGMGGFGFIYKVMFNLFKAHKDPRQNPIAYSCNRLRDKLLLQYCGSNYCTVSLSQADNNFLV